jgi:hypothetical protein
MGKIFYENFGCTISDAAFINPNGDQYKIQEISGVKVRQKDYWGVLFFGIIVVLLAFSSGTKYGFTHAQALLRFLVGLACIGYWWYNRELILWITSGDVDHAAVTFKKAETGGLEKIQEIYDALNKTITTLENK